MERLHSMDELYSKRLQCLTKQVNGKEMTEFLLIASFLGIDFSKYFVNIYFEDKEDLLKMLLERRYIMPSLKGYTFMHESLFLYLKNRLLNNRNEQRIVGTWLLNSPCIFEKLNKLKQGRVFLWTNNKSKARNAFSCAISVNTRIKNYSSKNIYSNFYE